MSGRKNIPENKKITLKRKKTWKIMIKWNEFLELNIPLA